MNISRSFRITANPDQYAVDTILEAHQEISACSEEISGKILRAVEKNTHIGVLHIWSGLINLKNGMLDKAEKDFLQAEKSADGKDWQPTYLLNKVREFIEGKHGLDLNADSDPLFNGTSVANRRQRPGKNNTVKNILFYYENLEPPNQPYAGTNAVISSLSQAINNLKNQFSVDLMGKLVQTEICHNGVRMFPVPPEEERDEFIKDYDVVLFASHLGCLAESKKHDHQKWILYQHCWKIEKIELERIGCFDAIICLSEKHKETVMAQGVNGDQIDIYANNIDTEFYKPQENVQRKNHSILFAGAIVPYKRLDILFAAFTFIRKKYADSTMDIYGNAAMWKAGNEYENELRYLNCPIVQYHGAVHSSRMPEIYSKHSIICIPSTLESFSLVSIEAQACGCIVVAHDTGGISVTVRDKDTGFLYAPNTAEMLAKTIDEAFIRIHQDKGIRDRSRTYIRDNFDIGENVGSFIDILEKRLHFRHPNQDFPK
jgi:glycosyltransferase involved in cell wall biosynthesis